MAYSKRFSRLFKRHFGTDAIDQVITQFSQLPAGASLPEDIAQMLGKFEGFLQGVEEAHDQYEDRMKVALRNIEISSDELNDANKQLERLNLSINAMLESLGQGLLFFDGTGICGPVYSKACLTLLEGKPVGRPVGEVLKLDAAAAARFQSLMDIVFNPASTAMSFDDLVTLAPAWYPHGGGRKIALTYRPMYKNEFDIRAILVIASDVTQEIEVQEAVRAYEQRARRILRIAREKEGFRRFIASLKGISALIGDITPDALRHDMHTLKGQARFFYLDDAAEIIHALETALQDAPRHERMEDVLQKTVATQLNDILLTAYAAIEEVWGDAADSTARTSTVPMQSLLDFGDTLSDAGIDQKIKDNFWYHLAAVPLRDMLSGFESQVLYFAERENCPIHIDMHLSQDIRVFAELYETVTDAMVHIARNIAVHAVDPPEIRKKAGKPVALHVLVKAERLAAAADTMILSVLDDGCGVDTGRLRHRLKQARPADTVDSMSDTEVLQTIFDDDMTTGDKVTEQSGRGVGLGVLRRAVVRMGGTVAVESTTGTGTTIRMHLPIFLKPER